MGYTHTMELYSASKWMNSCHIQPPGCVSQVMPSKRQTHKTAHAMWLPFVWNSWTCRPISDVRNKDCKLWGTELGTGKAHTGSLLSLASEGEAFLLPCMSVTLGFWWYFHVCKVFVKPVLCCNPLHINKKWLHVSQKEAPSRLPPYSANSSPSSCWQIREILSGWVTAGASESQEQILAF